MLASKERKAVLKARISSFSFFQLKPRSGRSSTNNVGARLLDAPTCVLFGIVMIWFAAITVNLGPTFITGALANHMEVTPIHPACPLIQTPYRHYIVNLLWVVVNSLCLVLTATHLYRLHRDLIRSRNQAMRVTG